MASLCKELYQFILAQGILLGISMAFIVTPMIAIISKHFQKKRAAAVGMVIAGSSLGGVIWPVVVHELLEKSNVGFGWTMRIVGFIMLPILGISSLSGRQPAPKTPPAPSSASSAGSDPEQVAKEDQPPTKPKLDFSVVKKPELQLSCAGFFIVYFGMFSPFFYTTAYAVDKGFSSNLSFYTISIINGASLFGRIIPGIVADKYGKFNLCILATMLSGIIAFCWTKVTSVAGLVIFSAAYGFCSGVSGRHPPGIYRKYTNRPNRRQSYHFNKPVLLKSPHQLPWVQSSESSWARALFRTLSISRTSFP